jgi:hypothetical protein
VQRLQDANDKSRAELADSAQKLDEKSRQKRKLYEMYTALKQKAENQGLLFSPSSSHRSIASAPHYDPPPLPVSSAPVLQPPPPPPMLNYRRNSSPTRQPPVASAFAGAAALRAKGRVGVCRRWRQAPSVQQPVVAPRRRASRH